MVSSGKETTAADLLADIQRHILENQAGKTAANKFDVANIIPLSDEIEISDTVAAADKGLWFEITNDAGSGTTTPEVAGRIGQSVVTYYPTLYGQITEDAGWGVGVMAQGVIGTTVLINDLGDPYHL